jgi:protoporphyrinogen oxidase
MDVIVVGAGPAGLTAAYLLSKKSALSVKVIESNPHYVGGISRTEHYNGFSFDIGGHRFFSKSSAIEALWHEILPDDFIVRRRSSRIFYKGKFYSYPLRAFETLRNLGVLESALCLASYGRSRLFRKPSPKSFHDWVANQFGDRLFRIFFKTYTEKIWGMSCDDISADWAAQRIKGLNLANAILTALRKSFAMESSQPKSGAVIKTLIESFRYPSKGPGMMWEAAARKVEEQGGSIEMGVTATSFVFNCETKKWRVEAARCNGERIVYDAVHVVVSAPMRDVVTSIVPRPHSAILAEKLQYRDFITVALILNVEPVFDDNWIYIHEPSVLVGRVQNYSSWSPEMVPGPGVGCLGLEYFCTEGDNLWRKSDAELVELAITELETMGLAARSEVTDGRVVRQPKAYPVYDGGYKKNVEEIRSEIESRYRNFHLVGRNGMHKYNNQDHAMMTAMLTVENILAGTKLYDIWHINEDAEYHEEGNVGDLEALKSVREVPVTIVDD